MATTGAERQKRHRDKMRAFVRAAFTEEPPDPEKLRRAIVWQAAQHGISVEDLVRACHHYVRTQG